MHSDWHLGARDAPETCQQALYFDVTIDVPPRPMLPDSLSLSGIWILTEHGTDTSLKES